MPRGDAILSLALARFERARVCSLMERILAACNLGFADKHVRGVPFPYYIGRPAMLYTTALPEPITHYGTRCTSLRYN